MQDSGPDSDIFIVNKLENSVPEDFDVPKHFAWAKLLNGFQSDVIVFVVSVFEDNINVLGIPNAIHDLLLVEVDNTMVLLLIVTTLWHSQFNYTVTVFILLMM